MADVFHFNLLKSPHFCVVHVQPDSNQLTTLFTSHKYFFLTLIKNVNAVDIREIGAASPKSCAAFAISDNIKGFIDFESDITRIGGEVDKLNAEISTLSAQLGSLALKEAKTAENKVYLKKKLLAI